MQAKPSDAEGSAHADSGRGDTGRGDTGRGDTGAPGDSGEPPAEYGCPVGMAPVPSDSPSYCIDAYELSEAGASVASVAGALPITGITYDDAVAACEARVVLDDAGGAYATPHLATASEWEDAGDGVLGAGGAAFPWGGDLR
jgi:formylglycine-generating enzyme required for sulfatase activity